MILLIDNYDSFTYNLYQYIGTFTPDIRVVRNDAITIGEIENMQPERIVLSPGSKSPKEAGICMDVVKHFYNKIPILGICLGHQCIGEAFGGTVSYAKTLFHGKQSEVTHCLDGVFTGIDTPVKVARYHSLAVLRDDLPECLKVTAQTADGEIMAMRHKEYPVVGLQFHPESIYTEHGKRDDREFPVGCHLREEQRMILDQIVSDKKRRLPEHKRRIPEQEMRKLAEAYEGSHHDFKGALEGDVISIIGEFKKASPSLGKIKSKINLLDRIEEYNASVDAISCLTEEDHFDGSTAYLEQIRQMTDLPILRKDFMIDPYQFYEARAIGADAVLLIAAILDDVQMHGFYQLAGELGLDALVEVHDEAEMERALKLDAKIIGVNNRNLKDFSIDLQTTERLSRMVPQEKLLVAESGIVSDEDVEFLKACGVNAFLIGRAFMEAEHPGEVAARWKQR